MTKRLLTGWFSQQKEMITFEKMIGYLPYLKEEELKKVKQIIAVLLSENGEETARQEQSFSRRSKKNSSSSGQSQFEDEKTLDETIDEARQTLKKAKQKENLNRFQRAKGRIGE